MTAYPARTHHVYRAFDESDLLLYVGCSGNIAARLAKHRYNPSIWYQYQTRIDVAGTWVKDQALDVEATAIRTEGPFFNAQPEHTRGVQANRNEARRLLALEGIPRDAFYDDYAPAAEMDAAADEYSARMWETRLALREGAFPYVDDETRRSWYLAAARTLRAA